MISLRSVLYISKSTEAVESQPKPWNSVRQFEWDGLGLKHDLADYIFKEQAIRKLMS